MSSAFIPKAKLSAYQRWELNSFDTTPKPESRSGADRRQSDEDEQRTVREAAYRDGFDSGYKNGAQEASAQAALFADLSKCMREETAVLDEALAQDVLKLAVTIAQRVLQQAIAVRPDAVLPIVKEVIRRHVHGRMPVTLRLNPVDAQLVRARLGETLVAQGWTLTDDAAIARGGCALDSASGDIDASLPGCWKQITETLGHGEPWVAEETS